MSECGKVQRLLSWYLDREMFGREAFRIRAHLDGCAVCMKEFSELSRIKKLLTEKERKTLPQDLLIFSLREAIEGERSAEGKLSWLSGAGELSHKLIPVPVFVIILLIMLHILNPGQRTSRYSLEESILDGNKATTEMALALILRQRD
jgi:predicted anti-sigma-YlaC factor YlaD